MRKMAENKPIDDLEFLIQKFYSLYEKTYAHNYTDSDNEVSLHKLAKHLIERLSADEFSLRDGNFHIFGYKLSKVFKNVQDKDNLIKIAKLYENLGKYYLAKENYLLSSDWNNIIGFISRSIQNPKSIYEGVSVLKGLKGKLEDFPPSLVDMTFYKAFGFKKYDLALDVAYLTKDKWREEEVLSATGLTQNQLL